jgi:MazG family protein
MNYSATTPAFIRLLDIMARLRSDKGCPWDAEQTPQSLKPYLLKETYEVLEAIDRNDPAAVCEELGDLLLQIVFQARIFEERLDFSMRDVIDGITEKLIRRHPHVFSEQASITSEEVSSQWDRIKKQEKSAKGQSQSVLGQVPPALPALLRVSKLTDRASRVGFDWPEVDGAFAKVHEELGEFEEALKSRNQQAMEDELGDMLFAAANLGRFLNIDPEGALRKTIARFIRRFNHVEQSLHNSGRHFQDTSLDEMSKLWQEAKSREGKNQPGK